MNTADEYSQDYEMHEIVDAPDVVVNEDTSLTTQDTSTIQSSRRIPRLSRQNLSGNELPYSFEEESSSSSPNLHHPTSTEREGRRHSFTIKNKFIAGTCIAALIVLLTVFAVTVYRCSTKGGNTQK